MSKQFRIVSTKPCACGKCAPRVPAKPVLASANPFANLPAAPTLRGAEQPAPAAPDLAAAIKAARSRSTQSNERGRK